MIIVRFDFRLRDLGGGGNSDNIRGLSVVLPTPTLLKLEWSLLEKIQIVSHRSIEG